MVLFAHPLCAGVYTFQLMHNTWGAADLEPSVANISITYAPTISAVAPTTNVSSFGGITLNITGFGFAPMIRPAAVPPYQPADSSNSSNSSGNGNGTSSSSGNSSMAEPGSLTTPVLDHYAVASAALPPAASGVLGVPLIPWDLTMPSSVQHLAPHNPPSVTDVAAAGLAVAVTAVQAKGLATSCMVLEATETWLSCRLQRSSSQLKDASNYLQVRSSGVECVAHP